jgi:hypothetical protein
MACVSQPSPLHAARQRAQALADSGDLGQARAVLEHAVGLGRANLSDDDPEVLATAQQLAAVHRQGDAPSAARRVLEEAYAAGLRRLGDTDPVMLGISFDLGMVAEEMENRHEARRAFTRVAAHGPGVLGADHWAVVRARSYLGEDTPTALMALPTAPPKPLQVPPQREAPHGQPVTPYQNRPATQHFPAPPQTGPRYEQAPPPTFPQSAPPSYDQGTPQNFQQSAPPSNDRPASPSYEQAGPPSYEQAGPQSYEHVAPASYDRGAHAGQGAPRHYEPVRYEQPLHHPMPQIISAPPITTAVPVNAGDSSYSRKAPALFAAIAAVLGVIIAVVALVVVLANRGDDPDSDVPTLSGPAPTDVRMRDYGSSVRLSWADPANGRTSFVITGGRPGEQLAPMGQVGPTTTSFNLNGLNPDLDYCFAIVAVYSTSQFSTSPQTCTSRSRKSGKPTATK